LCCCAAPRARPSSPRNVSYREGLWSGRQIAAPGAPCCFRCHSWIVEHPCRSGRTCLQVLPAEPSHSTHPARRSLWHATGSRPCFAHISRRVLKGGCISQRQPNRFWAIQWDLGPGHPGRQCCLHNRQYTNATKESRPEPATCLGPKQIYKPGIEVPCYRSRRDRMRSLTAQVGPQWPQSLITMMPSSNYTLVVVKGKKIPSGLSRDQQVPGEITLEERNPSRM
jgi:hypothetical protein